METAAEAMVTLVPPPESVMDILQKTGAYRRGHFIYPNGKHASHYFQMPLAFRYYDNARILSVGLSRMFRMEKAIASQLPKVSVISPSPGGIMVAFGVREALSAEQIYWAEMENGKRQFRQYMADSEVHPVIIVDDILRSGRAMHEQVQLKVEAHRSIIAIRRADHEQLVVEQERLGVIDSAAVFENAHAGRHQVLVIGVRDADQIRVV